MGMCTVLVGWPLGPELSGPGTGPQPEKGGESLMDRQYEHIQEVIERIAALEAQVQKLDRLVYKLFKRLPQPNQYRQD